MSQYRIDQITNQAGTAGPQVAGITTFSGVSGIIMPSGAEEYRGGRGRGVFAGGNTPADTNTIDYITISTASNAYDFGDVTVARRDAAAFGSSTRGLYAGGATPSNSNVIDYITFASTGNAFDFGDCINTAGNAKGGVSNNIRGVFGGGFVVNTIEFVTISTLGNSSNFGEFACVGRMQMGSVNSPTRGIFIGGATTPFSPRTNTLDYITITTLGNAQDFGDINNVVNGVNQGVISSTTRGVFGGGYTTPAVSSAINVIEYLTIATLGNAIDFGDLSNPTMSHGGCSTGVRGVFMGGYGGPTPTVRNVLEFITIASTGNATDFGDLNRGVGYHGCGASDAHGGLGD